MALIEKVDNMQQQMSNPSEKMDTLRKKSKGSARNIKHYNRNKECS